MAPRKWPGELGKPIRPVVNRPRNLAITDPETVAKANEEMIRLYSEAVDKAVRLKLRLLLSHYQIEGDDWFALARELAVDHVPGFAVINPLIEFQVDWDGSKDQHFSGFVDYPGAKTGRPSTWPAHRLDQLLDCVEETKKKHRLREDKEALAWLARRKEWKPPANHRGGLDSWIKTLQNRLNSAKAIRRRAAELTEELEKIIAEVSEKIANENPGN